MKHTYTRQANAEMSKQVASGTCSYHCGLKGQYYSLPLSRNCVMNFSRYSRPIARIRTVDWHTLPDGTATVHKNSRSCINTVWSGSFAESDTKHAFSLFFSPPGYAIWKSRSTIESLYCTEHPAAADGSNTLSELPQRPGTRFASCMCKLPFERELLV